MRSAQLRHKKWQARTYFKSWEDQPVKSSIALAAVAALSFASMGAQGQERVKLINVVELSGAGATAGTNWKNGIDLAVPDINAKGGMMGRQIDIVHYDA
jgi:branched-chain amino acid transport system substrate-binding protein